ncbi:hypothetical protein [Paenibacillus massiliensis]|uniref:DUF7638 domain-containing protein n=1 Tax=Paenibacillus massiliensis TaxID=225917 RepID=UPI0004719792|nr:hypothetical protein [Paenibacillus massiliensis]
MQRIRRQKQVEGTTTHGIIHNADHHFLVQVQIYEDGMVNCWELVDLKGLGQKIDEYWLGPDIPDGETLSLHGLGAFIVGTADWSFDNDSYYQHIEGKVRSLNPEFRNIYEITARERELMEVRRISPSPKAVDFVVIQEMFYSTIEGDGFCMFMREQGENYLVNLVVYENGIVHIYGLPDSREIPIENLEASFADGTLFTTGAYPLVVSIPELGKITFTEELYAEVAEDKYKELLDKYKKLKGEQTSLEECRAAYHLYLEFPSEFNRERLKTAYEQVPEHMRMYLGDMDTRDSDYQRILYSPEDKREV